MGSILATPAQESSAITETSGLTTRFPLWQPHRVMTKHPLTKFREDRAMTKAQLGRLLNVNRALITHWEGGRCSPRRHTAIAISEKTGISAAELLGVEERAQ